MGFWELWCSQNHFTKHIRAIYIRYSNHLIYLNIHSYAIMFPRGWYKVKLIALENIHNFFFRRLVWADNSFLITFHQICIPTAFWHSWLTLSRAVVVIAGVAPPPARCQTLWKYSYFYILARILMNVVVFVVGCVNYRRTRDSRLNIPIPLATKHKQNIQDANF